MLKQMVVKNGKWNIREKYNFGEKLDNPERDVTSIHHRLGSLFLDESSDAF